ncbi:MAG: ABC transporter ATP-binding protein [Chloroflexi bacterium]|nr:ABC transporter ATP-binding protein [Chloroflexota bacterium]
MTTAQRTALTVDIDVRRDGFRVQVAFEAGREVVALFGPSGAGKTTTLNAIAGLVTPAKGTIAIDGTALFAGGGREAVNVPARARKIGYVFQSYALFPHLTALKNVAYPLGGAPDAESQAMGHLETLGMADFAHRYPDELSGGQQQRVAIARALAREPRLLLLDEPFTALDESLRRALRKELRAICDRMQIPVVLVTHDLSEVLALADRVVVLERGRVVTQGSPLAVLQRPGAETVSRLVGVENIFEGTVLSSSQAEGVTTCDLGGLRLEVPYAPLSQGARVRIGLRAGDIIVAGERPSGLSARNTIAGVVRAVARKGFEAEAIVDCGRDVRVEVTPRAVKSLGIAPGKGVWLVIKTNSCFLIE